ncbi:MAG: WXG100 family type VII secretion target [Lachnospiraceae bacterium]|nr:WXG100 family type VII secretion target [Lachnospiraceae bacterium]
MGVIDIDFSKARAQAGKLRQLSSDLSQLIDNEYAETIEQIRGNWTGESANAYLNKAVLLDGEMQATATKIKEIADSIDDKLDKLEKAQKDAQAIISGKNY